VLNELKINDNFKPNITVNEIIDGFDLEKDHYKNQYDIKSILKSNTNFDSLEILHYILFLNKLNNITVDVLLKSYFYCNIKKSFKDVISIDNNIDCIHMNILTDDEYNDVFYPNSKLKDASLTVEMNKLKTYKYFFYKVLIINFFYFIYII